MSNARVSHLDAVRDASGIRIAPYAGARDEEIIALILGIQNDENHLGLTLEDQPDLLDIEGAYQRTGGQFWLALDGERLVGTIGLKAREYGCAILKKFFVDADYRRSGVGARLYEELLAFARAAGIERLILDTPAIARAAHRFCERAGFRLITRAEPPIPCDVPDWDCDLYLLDVPAED